MSDGRKAMYDDMEEEAQKKLTEKYESVSKQQHINNLNNAIDELNRFFLSDPALTRTQFSRLDRVKDYLYKSFGNSAV